MGRSSTKFQYFAAFAANLSNVLYGISCGWTTPTFPILESVDTPIPTGPLSPAELSWVGSLLCLGGLTGTIVFGNIVDYIGRKPSLCLLCVPNFISYSLIFWAQNVDYLYAARFFAGFAGGGVFVVVPLYIAEIAESHIRGSLGSKLILFYNTGIVAAFVIGHYCGYKISAMIYLGLPIIYLLGVVYLPETPSYLLKRNRLHEAEKSLAFFRNVGKNFGCASSEQKVELEILKNQTACFNDKYSSNYINFRDFVTPKALKATLIGFLLLFVNQGCGIFAMLNYIATIFEEAGTSISGNIAAIIVGVLQVLGSYISTILVDRAGRKFCLGSSALGIGVGYIPMGIFQYMKMLEYDVSNYSWVPVASFSFVIFMANCGVLSLPFVLIAEIMPEKIRSYGQALCMMFLWIMAFLFVKYFYILSGLIGLHGCAFLFSAIAIFGFIFIGLVVPETKGKTLEDIQKIL